MTELHAGYRVPPAEMDDIPMDNFSSRVQSSRTTGAYQQRIDAQNCCNYAIQHRLAVVLGALLIGAVLAFIAIATYLAITPDTNYTKVEINKITQVSYPVTEDAVVGYQENRVGARGPGYNIQDELSNENLNTLWDDTLRVINSYQSTGRMKREIEVASVESCKEKHENCKILLNKVKNMTRNVSRQVHQLQKMINRLGILNEELPSLQNITALDFATCLRCEKLENQTASLNLTTTQPSSDSPSNISNQSKVENTQIYKKSTIDYALPHNNENSLISTTDVTILVENSTVQFENSHNETLLPVVKEATAISNCSITTSSTSNEPTHQSSQNNSTVNLMNTVIEDAENEVDSFHGNDKNEDFFFVHSQFDGNSGPKIEQVKPIDKPEVLEPSSSSFNDKETVSTTTEGNLAVLTTTNPENYGHSILTSNYMDQSYSPQSKSNHEPNTFLIPTAETMKTSQQLTYTPTITWMPHPLCVYGPPNAPPPSAHQSVRQSSSGKITFPVSSPASSSPQIEQSQRGQTLVSPILNGQMSSYNLNFVQPNQPVHSNNQPAQQGFQFVPMQYQPTSVPVLPQRYGPTGPGTQYFPTNQPGHQPTTTAQGRSVYCTYLPVPSFQFPVIPGVSEFQRAASETGSYPDKINDDVNGLNKFDKHVLKSRGCPPNTRMCNDHSRCIPKSRWCDGEVDCTDASDETRCSCRDRVDRERLCDGYFDCPLGEDELGCFGCDKHSFSCDESENRRRWGNCVPLVKRCDGYPDCTNGKDEKNCNIITHSVEEREMFTVGYTTGYLHRNWRGKWYPACTPSKTWATDACRAEIGDANFRDFPIVETVFLQQNYNGPYVIKSSPTEVQIVQSCSEKAVFVNCPTMPCGTRVSSQKDNSLFGIPYSQRFPPMRGLHQIASDVSDNYRSEEMKSKEETAGKSNPIENPSTSVNNETLNVSNATNSNDSILAASRVVGGRPSQPKAWPSLVAINRDGNFHCGGVILDEIWILTAAHCIDGYRRHYYDIQSGILRRFSYSPMEQSRKVSHVVMYPSYDKAVMKNDIALLRLESPLNFNRWVRPACLPEITTAGPYWRTGPIPETTCITAGWGSVVEHGPDPDHLREVELPILSNCKHLVDQNEAEICAGIPQGGRDTCQGDSGGPLMCRNPNSPSQWYVAGIVSHGEGCARPNEPGAYTKVSRFVEWINMIRDGSTLPMQRPLERCPGYHCHSGSRRCYPSKRRCDKSVDCMDAEDELNCQRFDDYSLFRNVNSENEDFLAIGPDASSNETEVSKNETAVTEGTTIASSAEPLTTAESSSTSADITIVQPTTTEPTESVEQSNKTVELVETLTTVTTIIQPAEEMNEHYTTTVLPDENLTTVTADKANGTAPPQPQQYFSCRILIQTIKLSKRCDKTVDCQDGTDEDNCTCKDYLSKISPASICDGHIDCRDGTDEENCEICAPNEFHCKRSRECVPMSKRCDRVGDCEFNEDELGCLTLTNGKYVIMDIDGLPHHNMEGILTIYEDGKWMPFCLDGRPNKPATLGKQMCSYFGFMGCESFNETRMHNVPLEVRESTSKNLIPYEYSSQYSLATDEEPRCTALYLRCLPTIHTVALAYRLKAIDGHKDDTFLWPWHAAVFVDGRYKCSAVLLEPNWLLTNIHCTENVDLNQNYTVALLGMSRSYLQVDGPHQQMSPVDEIKTVKNSDAVLLHLKYPTDMTRHVQPMYLQKRTHAPAESDTCATVGVDKEERTRTIFLKAVIHNCPDNHRCYRNANPMKCENETILPWSGTVVCFGCSGWYPAAVYHEEKGPCSFSKKQSLSSIDYINTNLITGMQETLNPSVQEPECNGFRCPLGECIDWRKVCDGVPHCRDGADEETDYCLVLKDRCANSVPGTIGCHCAQSELRCGSGQCVPKSSFCDGQVDCSDGTDEPVNCTCAAYLKLTAPEKICDGRRHCFDKSDESPDSCFCKDASFKCDKSGEVCVPQDFVCDGQEDCYSGEDEKECETLWSLSSDPPGYGEVIKRSYGVWHSRCFSAGALSENKLGTNDLCKKMGYNYVQNITESDISSPTHPRVVPVLDKFYMVRLNPRTWIVMRDDKALVSLHPPSETCYRHYVTCA